jgi:pimeloyl-ACP methyl ester carboxylesterase
VLASTPIRGRAMHTGGWRRAIGLAACLLRPARAAEACLARRVLSERFVARHPREVERIEERARRRPASHRGLAVLLGAALTHDVDDRIDALHVDTLVLAGSEDALLPAAEQRRLAERVRARFVVVPSVGHDVPVEAPDAVAALVTDHALRVSAGGCVPQPREWRG